MASTLLIPTALRAFTDGQGKVTLEGHTVGQLVAALAAPRDVWSNFQPGLAIASSRHETQYTRLFRS